MRCAHSLACARLVLMFATTSTFAHSIPAPLPPTQDSNPTLQAASDGRGYTLHVTTREVVVEVVARDHDNHPVNDLTQTDFDIFDGGRKSKDSLRPISGFRTIDPAAESVDRSGPSRSVMLPLGGRCEIRSTVHYEIAFHPAKWASGYHTIAVTTSRRHVTLSYRAQYYVGISDIQVLQASRKTKNADDDLQNAACYHSSVPASLALSALRLEADDPSRLRYTVKLLPGSLDSAGIDQTSHRVQLEYGVCTFSGAGHVIGYWHFTEDRSLNAAELSTVFDDGWSESMEVPLKGKPALARFVLLEPKSGNIGSIDLSTDHRVPFDVPEPASGPDPTHVLAVSDDMPTTAASRRSLGSAVPRQGALCGDVYELPPTTTFLPADFKVLHAVGAVYTNALDVPEQVLGQGIPGSTARSEWFGVDYYGEFWIRKPGDYLFVLNADDGADLYIDDHKLISDDGIHPPQTVSKSIRLQAGRHTLHLPYFQGPTYVNLILKIQPPGESLRVFNVRDFAAPSEH